VWIQFVCARFVCAQFVWVQFVCARFVCAQFVWVQFVCAQFVWVQFVCAQSSNITPTRCPVPMATVHSVTARQLFRHAQSYHNAIALCALAASLMRATGASAVCLSVCKNVGLCFNACLIQGYQKVSVQLIITTKTHKHSEQFQSPS
jgi:hypothetical protein